MSKVAWDYIVPVKLPADLKGVEPGKLPANLLKAAAGGGKLHHRACDAWNAMVEAAATEGVVLKPTSSGDTYREYELQKKDFYNATVFKIRELVRPRPLKVRLGI